MRVLEMKRLELTKERARCTYCISATYIREEGQLTWFRYLQSSPYPDSPALLVKIWGKMLPSRDGTLPAACFEPNPISRDPSYLRDTTKSSSNLP